MQEYMSIFFLITKQNFLRNIFYTIYCLKNFSKIRLVKCLKSPVLTKALHSTGDSMIILFSQWRSDVASVRLLQAALFRGVALLVGAVLWVSDTSRGSKSAIRMWEMPFQ